MGINEEYKLPDYIPCRGHLLLHGQKISKSRNWYIGLREFVATFNPDYLRFYLSSITPYSQADTNFGWDSFSEKINNELIANIGNFINRSLTFTQREFSGRVPHPGQYDSHDELSLSQIVVIAKEVGALLSALEIDKSLRRILQFSTHFNQYFQIKQPWARKESSHTTLFVAVNAVKSIAIIMAPFIPFSSQKIWHQLGMADKIDQQSWSSASRISIQPGHLLGKVEPLFVKIDKQMIDLQKKSLGIHNGNSQ
jgi:methionyl-tRNA synthetase